MLRRLPSDCACAFNSRSTTSKRTSANRKKISPSTGVEYSDERSLELARRLSAAVHSLFSTSLSGVVIGWPILLVVRTSDSQRSSHALLYHSLPVTLVASTCPALHSGHDDRCATQAREERG